VSNMASEQQIQADIMEYLRYKGYFVFKVHQQGKYCYKGISDLIAVKDGVTIYVEVKTPTGTLRPEQIKCMEDVQSHGAKYIVARSMDDVKAV
jgi:Holliday junction resolvase